MLRPLAVLVPGIGAGLLALAPTATAAPSALDTEQLLEGCAVNLEDNSTDLPLDTCMQDLPVPLAEIARMLGLS